MNVAVVVALLGGAFALAGAFMSTMGARAVERMKTAYDRQVKEVEDRKYTAIYSEPLARAAFDLQSRIYDIVRNNIAECYINNNDLRRTTYFIENTTFLVAQFFCWMEMTRQEINFIQLRSVGETRALLRCQDKIYAVWGAGDMPQEFRIFAGEQRAIGESLIRGESENTTCMGYGAFLKAFPHGESSLIDHVRADVACLPSTLKFASERLTKIQHLLIDVIDVIDPDNLRFPPLGRSKI